MDADQLIRRASREAQALLNIAYSTGAPEPDSALDQAGLRDGLEIVESYLAHNEAGLALEHLLYMVREPSLELSQAAWGDIASAAELLGMSNLLN